MALDFLAHTGDGAKGPAGHPGQIVEQPILALHDPRRSLLMSPTQWAGLPMCGHPMCGHWRHYGPGRDDRATRPRTGRIRQRTKDLLIVVTGAAGFIGSNLIAVLEAQGRSDIIACDWPPNCPEKQHNLAKRSLR